MALVKRRDNAVVQEGNSVAYQKCQGDHLAISGTGNNFLTIVERAFFHEPGISAGVVNIWRETRTVKCY